MRFYIACIMWAMRERKSGSGSSVWPAGCFCCHPAAALVRDNYYYMPAKVCMYICVNCSCNDLIMVIRNKPQNRASLPLSLSLFHEFLYTLNHNKATKQSIFVLIKFYRLPEPKPPPRPTNQHHRKFYNHARTYINVL